ncbi:glutamine-hydrolyzing GMP synthase [bacterium]|nr:glutamine-hydrolyzing GMP synthase [bacterium]
MDTIYVIDFGGQYAHLIANKIRRLNIYADIKHPCVNIDALKSAKGIILSGGPNSVYDENIPKINNKLFSMNIPILGLCFGHQLIVREFGGKVKPGFKEYGTARLALLDNSTIFKGLAEHEQVWMSHGDSVAALPDHFKVIGKTKDCPYAAIYNAQRNIFGFQFHPEVTHTTHGMAMLENFANICQCRKDWTIKGYLNDIFEKIKNQVKNKKVFMLVSGGVDSTVAFTMLNKILGEDRVLGLTIDNGFCRKNEIDQVRETMSKYNFHNLLIQDHSDTFLANTAGVAEPEKKRNIIGRTFIEAADSAMKKLGLNPDQWLLGQGTIYPDTIESGGTKNAAVIKTHHNRIDMIAEMVKKGLVVEPLVQLYKDEVRELGIELGLPEEMVWRHPFPGPGLAVRALCSNGEADDISNVLNPETIKICEKQGLKISVLPIRSVGVQGDVRSYAHPAVIYGKQDWKLYENISTSITNANPEINRVVAMIGSETLPELKLKKAYLWRDRLDMLRQIDAAVMDFLEENNLIRIIWQMPTVLLPLSSNGNKESIVLRPVITRDFMTASFAQIPFALLNNLAEDILAFDFIETVFFDITHKPPGTIEWE